ncbi:hypothetical protein [Mucilaginibacter celer]|uniref:Adhesin domain-containing protein n=1 Tax=Mucilaginibacter celer TaxID=2305508 RepID=A0A494VQ88_9SPHI|nr:hypothetical protein [Mucilaginibacter celer]AYL97696.1 hypothetical protein HYN43_021430 [Mucilaginibacter celer]
MKLKIFNPALLMLIGLLTISTANFAQVKPKTPRAAKPATPPPPAADTDDNDDDWTPATDSKEYQQKMKELNTKMRELQKQMSSLRQQQQKQMHLQMQMKMKNLAKLYKFKFNDSSFKFKSLDSLKFKQFDSMKFSQNFDMMVSPNINFGFKNFDQNFSFSYDDNSSYKEQLQNGDIVEKTKSYSKSYSIDGNDLINIDNKYGKVTVNTWAKNEVKVDVQIVVGANDEDKVQKMLDNVSIKDGKDGSGVWFKTSINQGDNDNDGGIWGSLFGKKNGFRKMEINYTVYMPAKNPLTINNKYGSTELPDLGGKLIINNSYGSLRARALTNPASQIKVRYGSATIETLTGSDLDVAYGSLNLGDCDKINADVSYGSAKIGKITTSGNINVKFSGALNIAEVDKNVKNLSVNSSYSSVKLGISDAQNADFDITVRYGSFNYNGHDVNITSKTPADGERGFNPTKTYKGHLGKGNSDKTITISTSYGSVSFD